MTIQEIRAAEDALFDRWILQAEDARWEEFDQASKHVHDWRTYVSEDVRAMWDTLPLIARCAIIDCCEASADREEWD